MALLLWILGNDDFTLKPKKPFVKLQIEIVQPNFFEGKYGIARIRTLLTKLIFLLVSVVGSGTVRNARILAFILTNTALASLYSR